MSGVVPKHSTQRRRRNKDGRPETIEVGRAVSKAPLLRSGIHPLAANWYNALIDSDQSRFYQPSDWATAQLIAEAIDEFAQTRRAALLDTILRGSSVLLVTEGDRRRMRLELTRKGQDDDEHAAIVALNEYQSRLGT